ncbi:meteorin-like protein, partial [Stegodyphus dumicola]|uniref:meteorin-like protein n=1 Tax=Stegodyphus dumicola TaxID=202533 RepID=UPI0015A9B90E
LSLECRPCSQRELIYLFCTSDFAVRGTISSLYENEITQRTELVVKARQILRDSEQKVFQTLSKSGKNLTTYSGVLYRPLQCGTRAGTGEFLFLGRRKLGDPILTCAPRWTEWKKIRQKAFSSGNLDCMLD